MVNDTELLTEQEVAALNERIAIILNKLDAVDQKIMVQGVAALALTKFVQNEVESLKPAATALDIIDPEMETAASAMFQGATAVLDSARGRAQSFGALAYESLVLGEGAET